MCRNDRLDSWKLEKRNGTQSKSETLEDLRHVQMKQLSNHRVSWSTTPPGLALFP